MKRILRLLTAALLGSGAILFATANPAGAAESIGHCLAEHFEEFEAETAGLDPSSSEYADIAEEYETTYEDCLDAPNPLLPEMNELIWGAFGFVVVFGFLAWKGVPVVRQTMADRTAKIQGDIDAAEATRAEAQQVKADYEASLADAKAEAARIIEEARQAADQLKADQQARLNDELAAAREQAQADIDAAKAQAMSELRNEVTSIAVGAAEQVVGANLDRDAQVRLVEDYINQVATAGRS